jgi:hypothetical protein
MFRRLAGRFSRTSDHSRVEAIKGDDGFWYFPENLLNHHALTEEDRALLRQLPEVQSFIRPDPDLAVPQ